MKIKHIKLQLSSQSILVVDDDNDLITLYKIFIKMIGYDLECFTHPILAFEHYKEFHDQYSLIITDLKMPGISGIELAKRIRKLNSTVKIYLITSYNIEGIQNQQAYKEAKFDLTLEKPVDFVALQKIIEHDLTSNIS